jgi:ABC-type multidrug transport system ATPase subunit
MSECLSLRAIFKSYHAGVRGCSATVAVLRNLDLVVDAGDIVSVAAAPGAGKTTLLMCASGLIRPDRGFVSWFAGPYRRDGSARPDGIAYASDRPFPYGFLTAREALEYAAIARDLPLRDSGQRVSSALDRLRLGAVADRRVDALTGSELARMAIASAMLARPRLLFVDDVASGCDAGTAVEIVAVLRDLVADGGAVVVTGALVPWLATNTAAQNPGSHRSLSLVAGRLIVPSEPVVTAPLRTAPSVSHARVAEMPPGMSARQNGGH